MESKIDSVMCSSSCSPILPGIGQVILDNGPNHFLDCVGVTLFDKCPAVVDQGDSPQRRSVSLRTSPLNKVSTFAHVPYK